jgi:sortase A
MAPRVWHRALQGVEWLLVLTALVAFGSVTAEWVRAQRQQTAARRVLQSVAPVAMTPPTAPPASGSAGASSESPAPVASPARTADETYTTRALVGELEVPRVQLSTLVFEVPDPATPRHAAGHVRGTALPWQPGNTAVAGHRDSAFRQLRGVRPGDQVRFVTPYGTFDYEVTRAFAVYPDEVWVLGDDAAALTLVTCFPFRWVGTAPERWVIHAKRVVP